MPPRISSAMVSTLLCLMLTGCSDSVDTATTSSSGGAGGAATASTSSTSNSSANSTGTGSGGDAEWTLVPWATPGCVVEYAKKPEFAFPALEWEPCPGGEPGCERIKKNWPYESESDFAQPAVLATGRGYRLGLHVGVQDHEPRMAYFTESGSPEAVYRAQLDPDCFLIRPGLASQGHWFGSQRLGVAEPSRFVFQPRGAPIEQAEVVPTTQLAQFQLGGEELLALQLDFGTGWLIYDRVTKVLHTAPPGFGALYPSLVGGSAFMARLMPSSIYEAWTFSRATGGFSQLIDRSPGHVISVQADIQDLVWIETPQKPGGGDWPAGTLMRSPVTTLASQVVGTPVRAMPAIPPPGKAVVGQGHFAILSSDNSYVLVRLSDGQLWSVDVPSVNGSYVSDMSHIDGAYLFFKTNTQIYRQRLDQLGPGQPAN